MVTLCSAIPSSCNSQWHQRLEEDKRAFEILGVDYLFGDFLDAQFRNTTYTSDEALFAPPLPYDSMIEDVRLLLETLVENNRNAILYAPLGAGLHVDHLIAFAVAKASDRFSAVHFYEDFPYAINCPGALETRLDTVGDNLTAVVTDIRQGFQKKIDAVGQYASQIHFLFGSFDVALDALIKDARRVMPEGAGERSWTLSAP